MQSVEAEKIEKAKVEAKLIEVAQRRAAKEEEFRRSSEQELEKKMEAIQENRDRLLSERVEKMKEHVIIDHFFVSFIIRRLISFTVWFIFSGKTR